MRLRVRHNRFSLYNGDRIMSIQYFYNFCLRDVDSTDLSGNLLTGVRRSYFSTAAKIKDKLTRGSDAQPLFYDFSIEKGKPMKWQVKDAAGKVIQDVRLSDDGKYYIYFYEDSALFKRLLFSKHHTLLKAEYFDKKTGAVRHTLEPRKSQVGLCILYTTKSDPRPIPLFEEPEIGDGALLELMRREYDVYTAVASSDSGVVRFLSEPQMAGFREALEKCEKELADTREESFVGDDTPLLDKINAKDFNVKRNLSSSLDITRAMEFGAHDAAEESPAEPELPAVSEAEALAISAVEEITQAVSAASATTPAEEPAAEEVTVKETGEADQTAVAEADTQPAEQTQEPEAAQEESSVPKPDKMIMADGAVYSYYGELDAQGNRSGYGRTMTELGRTAYEGRYLNDKRSGNGSYFYKNGMLCYTGDWLENVRHGVGVGVSSRDGSIHVGSWRNNKPDGSGVRLTAEGNIKFVCKELADGTTVLMNYLPDDTVLISKYDENGMKIGDTTISLKDLPI